MDTKHFYLESPQTAQKFLDCPICYEKSMSHHRSKKEEHAFKLCETCSKEIEKLKEKESL